MSMYEVHADDKDRWVLYRTGDGGFDVIAWFADKGDAEFARDAFEASLVMLQQGLNDIKAGRLHDHEDVKSEFLLGQKAEGRRQKAAAMSPSKEERERLRGMLAYGYGFSHKTSLLLLDALELAKAREALATGELHAAEESLISIRADRDDCLRRYGELYEERRRLVTAGERLVSGLRSHLQDLIHRIGPGRRPMDIRAALEEIHNSYNAWVDRSAEAERDRLRETLQELKDKDYLRCEHINRPEDSWCGCVPCRARAALDASTKKKPC